VEGSELHPRFFHRRCAIPLEQACNDFNHESFWEELFGRPVCGKLTPRCNDILHPTLRLWHKWLAITLFPRDDVRTARTDEMMILDAAVRQIKVFPVQAMIRQWLTNFKMTGSIECVCLISCIVTNLGVTQGPNVPSIVNPRTQIDEAYLTQGHILKKGLDDSLVFFYLGYANQNRLPNPDFRLYSQGPLIVRDEVADVGLKVC
jgi:hypothetical protein